MNDSRPAALAVVPCWAIPRSATPAPKKRAQDDPKRGVLGKSTRATDELDHEDAEKSRCERAKEKDPQRLPAEAEHGRHEKSQHDPGKRGMAECVTEQCPSSQQHERADRTTRCPESRDPEHDDARVPVREKEHVAQDREGVGLRHVHPCPPCSARASEACSRSVSFPP